MTDPERLFDTLVRLQHDRKLPPVGKWEPARVGEIDIRIGEDGAWFHDDRKIERQPLVDLFATILRKDDDGYCLVTPAEKLMIEVADVPFVATDLDVRGSGTQTDLLFTTNVGDYVVANAEHRLRMEGGKPYLMVRDGLEARLHRNVFYRLVDVGMEEEGALFVYSEGARFELGSTT
jgi:hypothetical protein